MSSHRHFKERWLHTRISEELEDALKREAKRRRSPVSLVVRNVLEGALDLVEGIVEDGLNVAQRSRRFAREIGRAGRSESTLEAIYGWQEIILNRAAACAQCDAPLGVGTAAYRGLRDEPGGPPVFLCSRCVRRLHHRAGEETEKKEGAA